MLALALAAALVGSPPEFAEKELTAEGRGAVLRGTFTAAVSPIPRAEPVVIIPGSGPTDRDGLNPLGVRAPYLRGLAHGLAARGVASVRVDKRGMFGSAAPGLDPNAVTLELYADDARAWAAALRRETGARCVWIAGHSEGALVALVAAQTPNPDVCGVVLISGMGRRMGDVLRAQLRANPANAPVLAEAEAAIAELEAGRRVDETALHPGLRPLFATPVQGFLLSLMQADPARLARTARGPVLIVQGETDLQTSPEDARTLKAARSDAEMVLLPGVNHVLAEAPAERAANLAAYADPNAVVAAAVPDAVADFLRRRRPRR